MATVIFLKTTQQKIIFNVLKELTILRKNDVIRMHSTAVCCDAHATHNQESMMINNRRSDSNETVDTETQHQAFIILHNDNKNNNIKTPYNTLCTAPAHTATC